MAIFQSQEFTFTNLAANATTTVYTPQATNQSAYGLLHAIVINTKGASANVCTVYNDVTAVAANTIATIDTVNGQIGTIFYDIKCPNGITVVIGTGTAANITVVWRKSGQE